MEKKDTESEYDEIKVLPMKKLVHSKNPGSSPEQR